MSNQDKQKIASLRAIAGNGPIMCACCGLTEPLAGREGIERNHVNGFEQWVIDNRQMLEDDASNFPHKTWTQYLNEIRSGRNLTVFVNRIAKQYGTVPGFNLLCALCNGNNEHGNCTIAAHQIPEVLYGIRNDNAARHSQFIAIQERIG